MRAGVQVEEEPRDDRTILARRNARLRSRRYPKCLTSHVVNRFAEEAARLPRQRDSKERTRRTSGAATEPKCQGPSAGGKKIDEPGAPIGRFERGISEEPRVIAHEVPNDRSLMNSRSFRKP